MSTSSAGYSVYVVRNLRGRFYIGLTNDVPKRLTQHNDGVSKWTRGKGPWKIVWENGDMTLSAARRLELELKRQKGGDGFYRLTGLAKVAGS